MRNEQGFMEMEIRVWKCKYEINEGWMQREWNV
jgi:hypothetical protein